jgi:hypothetical protein
MSTNGAGTPLKITSQRVFRGQDRTNGFLMRNSDGRIPALQEGASSFTIGASSALFTDGIIPWGNGLWRDLNQIDTKPGAVFSDKPTKAEFVGVLKFEQGLQTGHPVAGHGMQAAFMKGTLVRSGLVGFKQSMQAVGDEANYLLYLKGVVAQDVNTVRLVYSDWVAALKAGADGDKLGLFFGNASGFPIVSLVAAANVGAPTLANTVFAGFAEVYEKENNAIYFRLRDR